MFRFRSPLIAGALAAALASTTGYCVLTNTTDGQPPPAPVTTTPLRLLPPAVIPYPPEDPAAPDASD